MRVLLVLALAMLGQGADAQDLSVRLNHAGEYEAVVSAFVSGCGPDILPPESISISPGQITIVGQDFGPVICGVPPPGFQQTEVALLGPLAPGQYQIQWSQPNFFSVSVSFGVPARPVLVPLSSPLTLGILALLIVFLALQSNYVFKPTAEGMLRSSGLLPRSGGLTRRWASAHSFQVTSAFAA